MMNATVYKRAFSNDTNPFLLSSIRTDYGEEHFRRALRAARLHTQYYATLGKENLRSLEEILWELEGTLD
jgi:hypothetical protein